MNPRYYRFDSFSSDFHKSIDILLMGDSNEIRAQHVPKTLSRNFAGQTYRIGYDLAKERYGIQEVDVNDERTFSLKVTPDKDLITNLISDLEKMSLDKKVLLVDTTSIKHPLIFYLLKVLKEDLITNKVFFAYSEPEKYLEDKNNLMRKFELTDKFIGAGTMPGFLRGCLNFISKK